MPFKATFALVGTVIWAGGLGLPQAHHDPGPGHPVGVLVMAHGGSPEWNKTVSDALTPLSTRLPTVLALGMADPETLQAGLDSLTTLGVERVAVVRLFVSGASFYDRTRYLLGLSDDESHEAMPMLETRSGTDPPRPLDHHLEIATHADGLMVSDQVPLIVADRAATASNGHAQESVLLLAHGMGDETENEQVLAAMEGMAAEIRSRGFRRVESRTLREDWATERAAAEDAIRAHVAAEAASGRRVIVVPLRLSGFGPYAEVLSGLDYVATDGLLPHPAIADWLMGTALRVLREAGWDHPIGPAMPPMRLAR